MKKFIKRQILDIKKYGARELFRKFYLCINLLNLILTGMVAILPCIVIRLISPWFIVRVAKIPSGNFGDFVWMTGLYYCKKQLKINLPTKRHIDLVYIHYKDKIHNKQLAKMWKRKLNFFPSYLLDPINKVNKLIPGWKVHVIEEIASKKTGRDFDNLTDKCLPLDFTIEEEIYGKKMLSKFGLKDDDKFVCLAVRDSAYQLKKIPARFRDWSYHDYRNWDIDKFILAAEELAKKGYYVFRMGVVVEKPFNSNNPKIIDYANSNLRNDFLDVYLGAKCSFCIATGLGFDALATIFKRPLVLLISPLGGMGINNENTLLLFRHHILKKENRRLSLSEIFAHGVAYAMVTKIFEEKGIKLVDNTPEEIRDSVIEMAENLEFKRQLSSKDEELQKTFKSLFSLNTKRFGCHKEVTEPYRRYYRDQMRCSHSTKFLKNNRDWLR